MLSYEGKVYRPPSEWRSLIVQATVGCSNNTCTFCGMYKEDQFHIKDEKILFKELEDEARAFNGYEKIFIADGDALCLSTDRLLRLMAKLRELFPFCQRIGAYATALDVNRKSHEDLKRLKEAGLGILYIGLETGSNELLKKIKKNMKAEDYLAASEKLHQVGIAQSVTLITGLAGAGQSIQYAQETARVVSQMNPDYVSYLTLMLDEGSELLEDYHQGRFQPAGPDEALEEIYVFLDHFTGKGPCIFRSNHASNYLSLAGTLPEDLDRLKGQILQTTRSGAYKDEAFRRL